MSLHDVLDEAADLAMTGRRVTSSAVLARAARLDRRARRRRWAAGGGWLAAAAAAGIMVVVGLLPGPADPTEPAPSGSPGQVGLPGRWWTPQPWVALATDRPVGRASMVLQTVVDTPFLGFTTGGPRVEGAVLVGADGRTYRRLPWREGDGQVALSSDGRWAAWVSRDAGAPRARAVVHLLDLPAGQVHDARLPGEGSRVTQLVVRTDGSAVALGAIGAAGTLTRTWEVRPAGEGTARVRVRCRCAPDAIGLDGAGRLWAAGPEQVLPDVPLISEFRPAGSAESTVASPVLPVAPAGGVYLETVAPAGAGVSGWRLAVVAGAAAEGAVWPITSEDEVTDVAVLGWAAGGVVLRVQTQGEGRSAASIRLLDTRTGESRVSSRRATGRAIPVAVATEVIGDGRTVPGAEPVQRWDSREGLTVIAAGVLSTLITEARHNWWQLLLGLTLIVGLLDLARRGVHGGLRRRRQRQRPARSAGDR